MWWQTASTVWILGSSVGSSGSAFTGPSRAGRVANACRKQNALALCSQSAIVVLSGLKAKLVPELRADDETNDATCAIWLDESLLRKEAMPWPPLRTCRSTVDWSGFSSSRFGPTWPFESAALSVWQPPQPALAKTFAPGELEVSPEPPQPATSGRNAIRRAIVALSFMTRCLGTIAPWP